MDLIDIVNILAQTVRLATPLILACLAGLYSERAGIVDIGLEGKLLASAFTAATVAALTGSPWLALLAGIGGALLFSGVHGLASINFKGNQTISGVALNFLAAGLTTYLGTSWFKRGGFTPQLSADQRFGPLQLPFAAELRNVPIIGPIYSGLISGYSLITYFAILAVPITAWVLFRTRFGLRLRARHLGFVFQDFNLLSALTAAENVELACNLAGTVGKPAHARARQLLERVGLSNRLDFRPDQLSGGEKQRVAIARALANDPKLILADEPTANLDSGHGRDIARLLRRLAQEDGRSVVIVSHDDRLREVADRVLWLDDGAFGELERMAVDRSTAVSAEVDSVLWWFCSDACRLDYQARHPSSLEGAP